MTKKESYVERRQIFKDIWDSAVNNDMEGKTDEPIKNRVIKTLRLDEVDKYHIGKSKKEKIKNLRTVCNRILDFCDKQDADDILEGDKTNATEARPKRRKRKFIRKKHKSPTNLFKTVNITVGSAVTSQKPGVFRSLTRPTSPKTRTILKPKLKRLYVKAEVVESPANKIASTSNKIANSNISEVSGDSKKVARLVKKKRSPKKAKKKSSSGVTGKSAVNTN